MPLTNAELGLACLRGFLRVGVTGLVDTTSSEATLRGFAAVPRRLISKSPRIARPPARRSASPTARSWQLCWQLPCKT
jgi:hypothetical protein